MERTGVDALAVAVGNVHGLTTTPVPLDLDRLAAIKAAVPVPLVLHGASGLPDQQLGEAIRRGVAKININTELRQAYLAAMQSALAAVLSIHESVAWWRRGREAVTTAAVRSIHALSATSWASQRTGPRPCSSQSPAHNHPTGTSAGDSHLQEERTPHATTSPHVAVIGLGAMGLPMASHLATAFPVTGFDPFEPRRELAARSGIVAEATPGGACPGADIALLSVRDHAQAETALFGPDGVLSTLKPGSPVILTSTVGPDAARDLADKLDAAGYPLIDAPISGGGPIRAGNGDLLIVVGATDDALAAGQPVLDAPVLDADHRRAPARRRSGPQGHQPAPRRRPHRRRRRGDRLWPAASASTRPW